MYVYPTTTIQNHSVTTEELLQLALRQDEAGVIQRHGPLDGQRIKPQPGATCVIRARVSAGRGLSPILGLARRYAHPRDPCTQILPTLGPTVCKCYLHWAIWIPRVKVPGVDPCQERCYRHLSALLCGLSPCLPLGGDCVSLASLPRRFSRRLSVSGCISARPVEPIHILHQQRLRLLRVLRLLASACRPGRLPSMQAKKAVERGQLVQPARLQPNLAVRMYIATLRNCSDLGCGIYDPFHWPHTDLGFRVDYDLPQSC